MKKLVRFAIISGTMTVKSRVISKIINTDVMGAHDAREERSHTDQRVSARGCGASRQQAMGDGADGPAQHCAEE
jgi:hypothetical protein